MATIYPVFIFEALNTVPNAPSPRVLIILYFSMNKDAINSN